MTEKGHYMEEPRYLSSKNQGALPPIDSFINLIPWHGILQELVAIHKELVEARRERFLARKAEYESACFEAHIPCDWTVTFEEELP